MFFRDSQNYDSWVRMGLFIKGHFGDNDESYQLFDNFSKLGNNYEKNEKNREIWDGVKTDQNSVFLLIGRKRMMRNSTEK